MDSDSLNDFFHGTKLCWLVWLFLIAIGKILQAILLSNIWLIFLSLKWIYGTVFQGFPPIDIGLLIPMAISLWLIAKRILPLKNVKIGPMKVLALLLLIALTALSLQYKFLLAASTVDGETGMGTSVPILLLFFAIVAYYTYKRNYKVALPLSYVLGFLAGILSDAISAFGPYHSNTLVWGGGGLADADFLLPLVFYGTVWFMMKYGNSWMDEHKETGKHRAKPAKK